MGIGSILADKISSATKAGLDAARAVANWTADKVEAVYAAAKKKIEDVVEKGKQTVADSLGSTIATAATTIRAIKSTKKNISDLIDEAVAIVFGNNGKNEPQFAVQPCPRNVEKNKEETRKKRKALIEEGKKSNNLKIREVAEELQRDMDAIEDARLSDHIYCIHDPNDCNPENREVPGFKDVSKDQEALKKLGLNKKDLNPPGSNFRAAVFERTSPPFAPEDAGYVVAFKGTTPDNTEDWQNNIKQGMNTDSPYYRRAVQIGIRISHKIGDASSPKVSFTGHSLGGGLASAAAIASGKPANTFNAAGLHPKTVERYGGDWHNPDINAYSLSDDPLNKANQYTNPAAGTPRSLKEKGGHSMSPMKDAIEKHKKISEEKLR